MRYLIIFILCVNSLYSQGGYTKYEIEAGKQNFSPNEGVFPFSVKNDGVTLQMYFDSSAYWTLNDWDGDLDYFDYNKGVGLTSAFSENNRNSVFLGWRPNYAIPYTFEVAVYTNDRKKKWNLSKPVIVGVGEVVEAQLTLDKRGISYTLFGGEASFRGVHPWRRPWYKKYRRSGTWIGGANNSPKPFGGESTQDMTIYGKFCKD